MDINALLARAVELGASDIHLKVGEPAVFRLDGVLARYADSDPLSEAAMESILGTVAANVPSRLADFHRTGDLDMAYASEGLPRFRVNAFRQRGTISFAFRVIPNETPTLDRLGLPHGVQRLSDEHRGLVLVTGATGAGKTTTLAAMINRINHTRQQHIVTIEDPIEILHSDVHCIVNQREVGIDTESFGEALRHVLRQDPDVILIGELRDTESAETALQAAESGHLVFSTMHTLDAAETVGRMIEFFPENKQPQVRTILASVLRGIVSQRLLPRAKGGRVPAAEVMVNNARIAELIREHRPEEIPIAIAEGAFWDMQTFPQSLIALVLAGEVEPEVAANAATNRHDFTVALDFALKQRNASVREPWDDDEDFDVPRTSVPASHVPVVAAPAEHSVKPSVPVPVPAGRLASLRPAAGYAPPRSAGERPLGALETAGLAPSAAPVPPPIPVEESERLPDIRVTRPPSG